MRSVTPGGSLLQPPGAPSSRRIARVLHYQAAKLGGNLPPRKPHQPSGPKFGTLDDGRQILAIACDAARSNEPRRLTATKDDPKNSVSLREKLRGGR